MNGKNKNFLPMISKIVDEDKEYLIDILSKLVTYDSTMGNELKAQNFILNIFQDLNLQTKKIPLKTQDNLNAPSLAKPLIKYDNEKHFNVIGIHNADSVKGRSLILNGHIDVVPIGSEKLWTNAPFEPVVKGDWLFGRGSGDMKAGLASIIYCLYLIQKHEVNVDGKIILQSVIEEECTGNGALACLNEGFTADAAIIPEPFNETIMRAQVGVMWIDIDVYGKPAHVLDKSSGVNAIEHAFDLWNYLLKLEGQWNDDLKSKVKFNWVNEPINFNFGLIEGGEWRSSVPTHCKMGIRVSFDPDWEPKEVKKILERHVEKYYSQENKSSSCFAEITYNGFQSKGCIVDIDDSTFINTLTQSHLEVFKKQPIMYSSTATTDIRVLSNYGSIPSTCYGPIAKNIHGIDECVSISSTLSITKSILNFIFKWCGTS